MENEKRMTKIETNIDNIMGLLVDIKDTLKTLDNTYVRKTELTLIIQQRDKELTELKQELKDNKRNLPNWISSIVAVIAVAIAYFK